MSSSLLARRRITYSSENIKELFRIYLFQNMHVPAVRRPVNDTLAKITHRK